MRKLYLMNSSVLTSEGKYYYKFITEKDAKAIYNTAKKNGVKIISAIGYPATAEYMTKVLDDFVDAPRNEIHMSKGDIGLVCKLNYRIADPALKRNFMPKEKDFEWCLLIKIS